MNQRNLHPDIQEFVSSLIQLEEILVEHEQSFWALKITRIRQIAEKSDGYCIEAFLNLFGGMGSFNDLVLDSSPAANDIFRLERSRAYTLAQALK